MSKTTYALNEITIVLDKICNCKYFNCQVFIQFSQPRPQSNFKNPLSPSSLQQKDALGTRLYSSTFQQQVKFDTCHTIFRSGSLVFPDFFWINLTIFTFQSPLSTSQYQDFDISQVLEQPNKFQCQYGKANRDPAVNPLSANPAKWSNTLKQIVGKLPTNCLNVFDHFVKLVLKGLISVL